MRRILVTGAGGIGGVNFVRAIRSMNDFFIVGIDHFPYHIKFNELDKEYISPRHNSAEFIPLIKKIIKDDRIEFLHPQPEVEAEVIANRRGEIEAKTYLPLSSIFNICRDKYETAVRLHPLGLAPKTRLYTGISLEEAFGDLGSPLWIRARKGAGGRLSLPCNSPEEAETWIKLWTMMGKAKMEDFILQEYLPGNDYAWDSLWYRGELVTSYARMRLEYLFPHLSPSRITGTPTVAKIIHDERLNEISVKAVKAIDPEPHGFYCLDLREGRDDKPYVTEINVKAHTTLALWSYVATKHMGLEWWSNMSYLYVRIGLGFKEFENIPKYDIYPEGVTLLRHIDVGVKILYPNGEIERVAL
ncbi:hypothetical protein DRO35_00350 [Candidatus Bathyarchaeota archaeon]|nr:MAG: hypothetical protein DRO35_00350 [Candidatus Bathyarchaeota archaeon]